MADPIFTKSVNIVVKSISSDSYGNLIFTDDKDVVRRIGATRIPHFKDVIKPNMGVTLNYCANPHGGNDMLWNATPVKIGVVAPTHLEKSGALTAPDIKSVMSKEDWSEKDRIRQKSIERQTSLIQATLLATSNKIEVKDIGAYFRRFEELLETGVTKSKLVEEARRLGGVDTEEDNLPF